MHKAGLDSKIFILNKLKKVFYLHPSMIILS